MITLFPNNRQRTEAAAVALETYADAKGIGPSLQTTSETLTDLLSDLRHFAAAAGIDFEAAVRMSEFNYEAESS
jgi:hypothetical protein